MKKWAGVCLSTALLLTGCSAQADEGSVTRQTVAETSVTYADKLFDTSYVHTVDVTISEEDWEDLLANPLEKTKYEVDVTIDGETIENVSFATKGNTSLSAIASSDSDKYSFKINFGKYVDDQTYYGLNKLNLNNIYADATYMKDYISYQIFQEVGADAPLTSYVRLTVNGEDHGLYIAIEDVSEAFLDRTKNGEGVLYKPETEQLDNVAQGPGGDMPDRKDSDFEEGEMPSFDGNTPPDMNNSQGGNMPSFGGGMGGGPGGGGMPPGMNGNGNNSDSGMMTPPDMNGEDSGDFDGQSEDMPSFDGNTPPDMGDFDFDFGDGEMPSFGGGMGGFGSDDNGASLKYTDDEPDSYMDIFDNAETDAEEEDEERVIAALKGLSEYLEDPDSVDLSQYIDTSSVIRYFVAHNFVMNYDSYTGNMLHNYYLYENDGVLSMVPWDYNLAFGAFSMAGGSDSSDKASELINCGIDSPLSGASEGDRPMWSWITENSDYLEEYHKVYDELISSYFESGDFEAEVDRVYEMIRPYVEKDPDAEYTVDEFDTAVETLKTFCTQRAASIRKQLDGTLATVTDEQEESDRVDSMDINIEDMGTQNNGGNDHGPGEMNQGGPGRPDNNSSETPESTQSPDSTQAPEFEDEETKA